MAVNSVGGGGSNNNRTRDSGRDESKVQQKPKDPPKVEKESPAQAQQASTPAKNKVTPNAVKPEKDGFETKGSTSTQRGQQQALLGSTTAPEKVEAPEHARAGALEKVGLTAEDVVKAGQDAAPHLEKAAQAAVEGKYEEALGHLKNAATSSPEIAEKAVTGLAQNPKVTLTTLDAVTPDAAVARMPAEAFLRLVAGRLDPEHTPLGVDAPDLDELRQAFPGF